MFAWVTPRGGAVAVVGTVIPPMKIDEVLPGDPLQTLLGPFDGSAVGMVSEEGCNKGLVGHRARVFLLLANPTLEFPDLPRDLRLAKGRVEQHIREQLEPDVEVFFKYGQGQGGVVLTRIGTQAAAHNPVALTVH